VSEPTSMTMPAPTAPEQAPVVALPEQTLQQVPPSPQQEQESKPEGPLARFQHFWKGLRRGSIEKTPGFVVNHSSNVIGAAHVMTEMMMFKASNKDGKLIKGDIRNPINWVKDPIVTVFTDTFKKSKSENVAAGELFKGNPLKNIYQRVTDVEAATLRVAKNQHLVDGKIFTETKLANPWQTRSTLAGLVVWSLSALIPEKRDSEEEIERMSIKRRTNPVGYVAERIGQALWVPGWLDHKRQMIGLGVMASGICSAVGAWRGRVKLDNGMQRYAFNSGYLGTSTFTFLSSIPLLFASDDQRGYGGFGALMMGRLFFLPTSLYTKWKANEPGKGWYFSSMASFQAENFAQAMIGGAEKYKDANGNMVIVDHEAIRKEAKEKATLIKRERKNQSFANDQDGAVLSPVATANDNDRITVHPQGQQAVSENNDNTLTPHTHVVGGGAIVQKAMPDRGQEAQTVAGG
jgi:hypothetical protein